MVACERVCLGDQVGVVAQPIAGAFDLDHDGVVQQSVEQRGGDDRIDEDFAPFRIAPVRGQDHGTFFVSRVDQLEERRATVAPVGPRKPPGTLAPPLVMGN